LAVREAKNLFSSKNRELPSIGLAVNNISTHLAEHTLQLVNINIYTREIEILATPLDQPVQIFA